jgi:hypothetical protein
MSQIVYGGGWKEKRQERLKVKAWVSLFASIFGGAAASALSDPDWVLWLTASSFGCFAFSVVMFFVERPRGVGWVGMPNGGDLHKLYGSGGGEKGHSDKRRDEGSTGPELKDFKEHNQP